MSFVSPTMGRAVAPPADTSAVGAPAGATPASVDATAAPDAGASFSDVLQSEGSSTDSGAATDSSPSSMTPTLVGAHKRPQGRDKDSSATDDAAPSMPSVMTPWLMPLPAPAASPEDATRHDLPLSMEAVSVAAKTGAVIGAPRHDSRASMEEGPSDDAAALGVIARSLHPHDGTGATGSAGVSPVPTR
ncbi:MAG: hypothetical protein M3Y74_02515, partial [Chloroflexota bacterium]|nr:hypothetical protein [Chloroflexota bacterium]